MPNGAHMTQPMRAVYGPASAPQKPNYRKGTAGGIVPGCC